MTEQSAHSEESAAPESRSVSRAARIGQKINKAPWWQWWLVTAVIAWGGIKIQDWWHARSEVDPYAYAKMAAEYSTSTPATRRLIRLSMAKDYVENREFDEPIFVAILEDHPSGIIARGPTYPADPGWDKRRLVALLAADPNR